MKIYVIRLGEVYDFKDSRAFTFEYNQRGHQVYRVIEVNKNGQARAVISDEPKTFFSYRNANGSLADSGRKYRYDVNDGKEIIWMSDDGLGPSLSLRRRDGRSEEPDHARRVGHARRAACRRSKT
jgi:hypothetical protein